MFEDLEDPDPPQADMNALNRVAARAGRIRRRRALLIGVGAGAVVVAATVGSLALIASDDPDTRLVVDVPQTEPSLTTLPLDTSVVTSTTVAPTTVAGTVVPSTVTTVATTDETVATEAPTTTAEPTTTTAAATTTTAAPISDRPIVAIDGNGDAVLAQPTGALTVLFDGPDPDDPPPGEGETSGVDGVIVTADRSTAFVSLCCEPVAGNIFRTAVPTPATTDGPTTFGHAPALSPDGSRLAFVAYDALSVTDLSFTPVASIPENFDLGFTFDLVWIDSAHIVALRLGPAGTDLRILQLDGATLTETRPVTILPPSADVTGLGLAGRADGVVYLNGIVPSALAAFDSTTFVRIPTRDIALPATPLSAWVQDGEVRWVGPDRQLHIGATVVPGEYLWVR